MGARFGKIDQPRFSMIRAVKFSTRMDEPSSTSPPLSESSPFNTRRRANQLLVSSSPDSNHPCSRLLFREESKNETPSLIP